MNPEATDVSAWFNMLGEPLGFDEIADIAAYLRGLSLDPAMPVIGVKDWSEARIWCRHPVEEWWDAEEAERQQLQQRVRLPAADRAWLALTDSLHGAAAVAAARGGCADPGLIGAAAGAAIYAAHQYRLAQEAGVAAQHPFLRKHALFAGGRWPLGVHAGRFGIF